MTLGTGSGQWAHRRRMRRTDTKLAVAAAALTVFTITDESLAAQPVIDEIVVTARKRVEVLREVPQAVSVVTAEDVVRFGYTTSADFVRQTPNLMWHSILGMATPHIFLRGIGSTTFNGNQANAVGLHVDGVYQGATITYGFGLLDLERVEILKGPQGTLFGRNTTAGVINFIPRKPDPAEGTNAQVRATYGRFNEANLEAAGGFAISDEAAVRVAAVTLNRGGYVTNKNPTSGLKDQGAIDIWSARGQVRYVPGDFDILLNVHGGKNRSDIIPGKQVGVVCPAGVTVPRLGACTDFFGFRDTVNDRESFANFHSYDFIDTWGGGATVTWHGAGFDVVAQGGYDGNKRKLNNDSDAGAVLALKANTVSKYHQFSQEVRALSTGGGALSWIFGANYYEDDLEAFQNYAANGYGPGSLSRVFPVEEGVASSMHQETLSYAVFGEATYAITSRLKFTGGVRWTYDRRRADRHAFLFNATGYAVNFIDREIALSRVLVDTIPRTVVGRSWREWTGRANLAYDLTDDLMVYASYAHGFKGGDFNGGALFAPAEATIVNPEFLDSYEAGFKGSTHDRRITFEGAAFYYDFTDQQVSQNVPGATVTLQSLTNAAKTRVYGAEFSMTAQPTDALFLQAKAGLLDAKFKEFLLDPSNPATSFAGNRTASSPRLTLAGTARYDVPVGAYTLSAQLDGSYTGSHFFSADNNPVLYENGYWLANTSLALRSPGDRYSATVWVKNLFSEKYLVTGLANTSLGFIEVFPGMPRTFGLTVAASF
ncbi:MAG: TonB-dependent receptor [Proteobacteria bacterium]|nr:TonB-dependent receptor [Pseudomonadota bacterium]